MDHSFDSVLLTAAGLLLAAILASRASSRLGIPALLVFLLIGMLAGADGPGGLPFDDARLAQAVGIVSLALILFSGGLETNWPAVSSVAKRGLSLATIGVLVTAGLTGMFAAWALSLEWKEGLLLGAIVSSTDAAAVFSVLRSSGVSLKGRVQPLLEFESGTNDPMAVFLTAAMIQFITQPTFGIAQLLTSFAWQMALGAALGIGIGKAAAWALNRIALEADGLYPVVTLSLALLSYSATSVLGGNGFLAVYLSGVALAGENFVHKASLRRFHDGLAWLMQIVMFFVLGLLLLPSRLAPVAGGALAITFFLMFVARPAAVFASLALSPMALRYKLLVSWTGLRGAVPIVLATFPLLAGVRLAELYFDVVFFIVLTSVMLQGTLLPFVARKLKSVAPGVAHTVPLLERWPGQRTKGEMMELTVEPGAAVENKALVSAGLPKSVLVMMIGRGREFVVPRGGTTIRAGDELLILASADDLPVVRNLVEGSSPDTRAGAE